MSEQDSTRSPLAELKVDLAPGRDLWAGIAARIEDPALRDHCDLPEPLLT